MNYPVEHSPSYVPTPTDPELYDIVRIRWSSLLAQNTEPLYGDENDEQEGNGDEEPNGQITGTKRQLFQLPQEVILAEYSEEYRPVMAQKLVEQLKLNEDINPIGHVEFHHVSTDTQLNGIFYLLDNDSVLAWVECITGDDPESVGGETSYELAERLGIGKIWAAAMFNYEPTNPKMITVRPLDRRELFGLGEFLGGPTGTET